MGFCFRHIQYRPTQRAAGNACFVIRQRVGYRLRLHPLIHARNVEPVFAGRHAFLVHVRARFHTYRALKRNVRFGTPMVFAGPLTQFRVMEPGYARARQAATPTVFGAKSFTTVLRNSVSVFAQLPQLRQRVLAARKIVRHGEIHGIRKANVFSHIQYCLRTVL